MMEHLVLRPGPASSGLDRRTRARYQGCLLGGAVGDALGAPVEFDSVAAIRRRFGEAGIRDYVPVYGRAGAITDDTQMTLFTAEGLLRARVRGAEKGVCHYPGLLAEAYQRWYATQRPEDPGTHGMRRDGWLIGHDALYAQRAPGMTCMQALQRLPLDGLRARNDSKGCGGVMRVAPVGLYVASFLRPDDAGGARRAFGLAVEAAAITHGHPSGQLAAGVLAMLVARVVQGAPLADAALEARAELLRYPGHEETRVALDAALDAAAAGSPGATALARLGAGWVAEEALAMGVYCALVAPSFEEGVVLAVNHGGDSDSTGSIAGNLLGAMFGVEAIPPRWLVTLELREVIREMADDLASTPFWQMDAAGDADAGKPDARQVLDSEAAFYTRRYPG